MLNIARMANFAPEEMALELDPVKQEVGGYRKRDYLAERRACGNMQGATMTWHCSPGFHVWKRGRVGAGPLLVCLLYLPN